MYNLLVFFCLFAFGESCNSPSCPQGSSIINNCYGGNEPCCWWLAEPGNYWVCNGTDTFDTRKDECVNAYPSNTSNCTSNHTFMKYNNTLMCVEFYNQTESECPQGYELDIPGEGRWTCDMWTPVICNDTTISSDIYNKKYQKEKLKRLSR